MTKAAIFAGLAFAYVAAVHVADCLALRGAALGIDWGVLALRMDGGFDVFKFVAWLVVPLLLGLRGFDVRYFTFRRCKRFDWVLLGIATLGGAVLMLLLPWLPGAGTYYGGWGGHPPELRNALLSYHLWWTVSWLLGWEFVHRYFLVKSFLAAWPKRGATVVLIAVPLLETAYHALQQKPPLECLGMLALSVLLCAWTLHRRNALLPFLAHLAIELELLVFLYFS